MSKSQISAVGSMHSWPNCLAMLNWMVDINMVTHPLEKRLMEGEREAFDG